MASRFRFSGVPGRGPGDPWFRVGTVDVDTSLLVVGLCVAMWIPLAIVPGLLGALALFPHEAVLGQLWRVVTWPLAEQADFWPALTLLFFWYFARQLEERLGRRSMASMLLTLTVALSAIAIAISLIFQVPVPVLGGMSNLQLIVVLLFIAEFPHIRFFFDIPGWVFGVAIVFIQVLQLVTRARVGGFYYLILLIGSLLAGALVARSYGLLQDYAQIPRLSLRRKQRAPKQRRARGGSSGGVVTGPWAGSSSPDTSDRAKLDALLDKIHESGMASLSKAELKQLETLRKRIRGE